MFHVSEIVKKNIINKYFFQSDIVGAQLESDNVQFFIS